MTTPRSSERAGSAPVRNRTVAAAGVVVTGAMLAVRTAALAALVYAGLPPEVRADGLALALIGTAIAAAWIALRASVPGLQAAPDGVPAAVIAVGAGVLTTRVAPEALHGSMLALVSITALVTGVTLAALGAAGAGRLIRYLPHPVVGGVLAATGWVLIAGAVDLMARPTGVAWHQPEAWLRWAPGVALGVWMLAFKRQVRHPLVVPGMLAAGLAAFYLVALANGFGRERLQAAGWLLGPLPDGSLLRLPPVERWFEADLAALVTMVPTILTAALTAGLLVALFASAVELERGVDADPNYDLRATGFANVLASVFGGLPTAVSTSASALALGMGADRRSDALGSALLAGAVVLTGTAVLGSVPLTLLGALLVMMGGEYLYDWLLAGARKFSAADLMIVAAIVAVAAIWGLLPGIAVGLAAAVVLFVVLVARTDVVGPMRGGEHHRSRVTRSGQARAFLDQHAARIAVASLGGVVFFGTADRLVMRVKQRLQREPVPSQLVIDVSRAHTFDATGGIAMQRIARAVASSGSKLRMVGAGPQVRATLERSGVAVEHAPDLDRALQACEDELLATAPEVRAEPELRDLMDRLPGGASSWHAMKPWFDPLRVPAGTAVVRQGEPGDAFWIVASGRVEAVRRDANGGQVRLESVGAGQVLGELAFLTGEPRSAELVAAEATELLQMNRASWQALSEERPDVALSLRDLLLRLASDRVRHLSSALQVALESQRFN